MSKAKVKTPEEEKLQRMKMIIRYFNYEKGCLELEHFAAGGNVYWGNKIKESKKKMEDMLIKYPYLVPVAQIYNEGKLNEGLSNYRRPIQSP